MPFRDVVGHRRVIDLMARAAARGTLPPSLILGGPAQVGKATIALALAQLLNCERVPEGKPLVSSPTPSDACGECASCRRIARAGAAFRGGTERPAVDCLQWLEPDDKSSIKIDAVRQVLGGRLQNGSWVEGRVGYRPFDGRRRMVVINDAHTLEVPAQQALLKMLEEPPSATCFVLITAQPDALLATIRSRCPQLRFGLLSADEIARALVERHEWSPAEAQTAASLAGGRLGWALTERDSALRTARDVAAEVLEQVAGSRGALERLEAAQALLSGKPATGKPGSGPSRSGTPTRQELSARLEAMTALLRDISILTTRADRRCLAKVDLSAQLDGLAPAFAGDRLPRAFSVVDQARMAIERNASQKVVADWLVLNL
jgi:DNA polymerase-3 subunit delta'